MATEPVPFDIAGPLPTGLTVLEASAGTGKTYALVALAVRSIAERDLLASGLCMVSFTEAATAELRGRLRARLVEVADLLDRWPDDTGDPVAAAIATGRGPADLAVCIRRLRTAVNDFDMAQINTIHGFCSRLLASAGLTTEASSFETGDADITEVVNDLLIARSTAITEGANPYAALSSSRVVDAVATRMRMPNAEMERYEEPTDSTNKIVLNSLPKRQAANAAAELVDEAVHIVSERQRQARRRTADRLISDARDLLRSPLGTRVRESLRTRLRLVLIDEFQDTDRAQWEIFHTLFVGDEGAPVTVLVGDPKQSIYRFRSAELAAYLDAVETADAVATLRVNHRSDLAVLDGLDHLLRHFPFGDSRVTFQSVDATDAAGDRRIRGVDHLFPGAVEVRVVPQDAGSLSTGAAETQVRADVVATVAGLLNTSPEAPVSVASPAGWRPINARDIAILVPTNSLAARTVLDLGAAGIPAATAASNSVLNSDAAAQWATLLRALEHPSASGAARAGALGWFGGFTAEEVDAFDDEALGALHERQRAWAAALMTGGIPALMSLARAAGLHERILGRVGGERHLTDLEHIAELLQAAVGGKPTSAAALHTLLGDGAGVADDTAANDALSRRIDRDDDAVQVLTVHKAKGLEFGVVLCPYLWKPPANSKSIPHADQRGVRKLSSAWVADISKAKWHTDLTDAASSESEAETHRVAYVALTRAQYQCVMWWAPITTVKRLGPIANLLATALDGPSATGPAPAAVHQFQPLVEASGGAVAVTPLAPTPTALPAARAGADQPLHVATFERPLDRSWRVWSFSAIKARAGGHDAPITGGADEPSMPASGSAGDPVSPRPGLPLLDAPGGTEFGTLVHEVLERCDFTSPTLRDDLVALCAEALRYRSLHITPLHLADGLVAALDAPLGGWLGEFRLRSLAGADRLNELTFDISLGSLRAEEVGEVLVRHLAPHDLLLPWAERVAHSGFAIPVSGMLTGSIDLVARTNGTPSPRYWIADYKTNRLAPDSGYTTADLVDAMAAHDYPLQAMLYLVALHRYLRWRVPGYSPSEHLGGAAYLFVRGMNPTLTADVATGVFWWHPPIEAILAVDLLLAEGGQP